MWFSFDRHRAFLCCGLKTDGFDIYYLEAVTPRKEYTCREEWPERSHQLTLTERTTMKPNSTNTHTPCIRSPIMPIFSIGELVSTCSVSDRMETDLAFSKFVANSLRRYITCDWGDSYKEDKKTNDKAVRNGERIHAVYKFDDSTTLWIITEWDRSVTTLLFPEDY